MTRIGGGGTISTSSGIWTCLRRRRPGDFLGRLGDSAEIGAVVAFLATDAAAYITGETIHVNGGMHMV